MGKSLGEMLAGMAITHGLTPGNLPKIDDFEHETHPCGCKAFRRDGTSTALHECCACHDAGWVRVPIPASERVRLPANEQVTPCQCARGKTEPNWADLAQIPTAYRVFRYETWSPDADEEALITARLYSECWPPAKPLFVLASPRKGNGKTALAVAVMYDAWGRHRIRGQFWAVPDLMQALRQAERDDLIGVVIESLRRYPLLVLDDLGAERDTSYATEQLYSLVNYRYSNALPTVVTTNVDGSQLDERIASRLRDPRLSCFVQLTGPDRRMRRAA